MNFMDDLKFFVKFSSFDNISCISWGKRLSSSADTSWIAFLTETQEEKFKNVRQVYFLTRYSSFVKSCSLSLCDLNCYKSPFLSLLSKERRVKIFIQSAGPFELLQLKFVWVLLPVQLLAIKLFRLEYHLHLHTMPLSSSGISRATNAVKYK